LCPRPHCGSFNYSAPPDSLAGFKGPISERRPGRDGSKKAGEGKEEKGKEGRE